MKKRLQYTFNHILLKWYKINKRNLQWRKTTNPYKIWLSEIILQQTRVKQGIPYYLNFLKNYPSLKDLAKAEETSVLRLWQGLGYYTRARNLLKCAKTIVLEFDGKFPEKVESLLTLPGIGPYTAAAIASFAFKKPVAAVDGNALRVFSRYFGITEDIRKGKVVKQITTMAQDTIDLKDPDLFNHAIMDLGSLVCLSDNPRCDQCPLMDNCIAYKNDLQKRIPYKSKAAKQCHRYFNYQVVVHDQDIGMQRRNGGDVWEGLYDFPLVESTKLLDEDEMDFSFIKEISNVNTLDISVDYKHILSHQVIHARFFMITLSQGSHKQFSRPIDFYSMEEIVALPKPILINNFLLEYFNSN